MPFRVYAENAELRPFMEDEVRSRIKSDLYQNLLGDAPAIGAAIPAYFIPYSALLEGEGLRAAVKIGVRYPILGDNTLGLVVINQGPGRKTAYGGLQFGDLPNQLIHASEFAEQQLAGSETVYEPRLLEIPALRFVSLWLASEHDDIFIPLSDGKGKSNDLLKGKQDFVSGLHDLLVETEARAANSHQTDTLKTPTN